MHTNQLKYWSETDLFVKLGEGNERAFGQVFKQYFSSLCYFANKYVYDSQEAEDIVEEVFEKLWNCNHHISCAEHLRSYLYMSTKRICMDHLSKNLHAKERQLKFAVKVGDQEPDFIYEMIRSEVFREIHLEIENLPDQCSRIVSMSYIEGLRNEEIAKKLGLSVQTVKNQKTRGVSILRGRIPLELFVLFMTLLVG